MSTVRPLTHGPPAAAAASWPQRSAARSVLVSQQQHWDFGPGRQEHLRVDVLLPLEHGVERVPGRDVVYDDGGHGVRVEDAAQAGEALLPRDVPQLHVQLAAAHAHALQSEVNADRARVLLQAPAATAAQGRESQRQREAVSASRCAAVAIRQCCSRVVGIWLRALWRERRIGQSYHTESLHRAEDNHALSGCTRH